MRRITAAALCGYLAGSVSFADVVTKRRGADDLRTRGTGNPGAMNARRVLGLRAGAAVLAGDVGKGVAASVLGRAIAGDPGAHVGGVAAVAGHCYPLAAGFRGGLGAATSFGQCLATFPAFVPLDVTIAWSASRLPWPARPAVATVAVSSLAWVAAGALWARKGWWNAWGPRPTAALPLANAATVVLLASRAGLDVARGAPDELAADR